MTPSTGKKRSDDKMDIDKIKADLTQNDYGVQRLSPLDMSPGIPVIFVLQCSDGPGVGEADKQPLLPGAGAGEGAGEPGSPSGWPRGPTPLRHVAFTQLQGMLGRARGRSQGGRRVPVHRGALHTIAGLK